jgi:hypothetical protein
METVNVNEPFVEEEWIGKGRKYDWAKLSAFVTSPRCEIRLQKWSEELTTALKLSKKCDSGENN